MAIDRRDFIKLASCAGLSVASPSVFAGKDLSGGRAGVASNHSLGSNPLFLVFNAGGGWDPTSFCDPKGRSSGNDPDPMNYYLKDDIAQTGNIRYPSGFPNDPNDATAGMFGLGIPTFFEKYASELLVVNGIDMQTNGHDSGSRHTWSGRLAEGFPSLGAYLAATYDPALPMAFLSFGGYSETAGIAPRTRAANLGVLRSLAFPTRGNPDDETTTYHSSRALELIEEAQWNRDQALIDGQGLPKIRNSMNTLFTSRSGSNELKRLIEYLPETQPDNGLQRQVQLSIAAYRAGIAISANLNTGGFDTHGNHDANQIPSLENLLAGVDYAMEEAGRQGVREDIVIIMGSDFGRTPGYNEGNGKDHWSVGSMMFMGNGITGNRVVGKTDEGHKAFAVNEDLSTTDIDGALKITPAHIHDSLRQKYAFGADNDLASLFPLTQETKLNVLG